jgi:hypothetical protein
MASLPENLSISQDAHHITKLNFQLPFFREFMDILDQLHSFSDNCTRPRYARIFAALSISDGPGPGNRRTGRQAILGGLATRKS